MKAVIGSIMTVILLTVAMSAMGGGLESRLEKSFTSAAMARK